MLNHLTQAKDAVENALTELSVNKGSPTEDLHVAQDEPHDLTLRQILDNLTTEAVNAAKPVPGWFSEGSDPRLIALHESVGEVAPLIEHFGKSMSPISEALSEVQVEVKIFNNCRTASAFRASDDTVFDKVGKVSGAVQKALTSMTPIRNKLVDLKKAANPGFYWGTDERFTKLGRLIDDLDSKFESEGGLRQQLMSVKTANKAVMRKVRSAVLPWSIDEAEKKLRKLERFLERRIAFLNNYDGRRRLSRVARRLLEAEERFGRP